MLCFAIREFRAVNIRVIGFFSLLLFCLHAEVQGQTTIWSEDFAGETGSSTSVLNGDQWTATETTASQNGTMSITSSSFRFTGGSPNVSYTCSWVSDEISIDGYTNIAISYSSSGSGGTSAPTLSMSNGTLSGSTFTPDAGASVTVITFSFSVAKNKYRILDNVVLTGTLSCTPTTWYADADGDGLGDSGSTTSASSQPAV